MEAMEDQHHPIVAAHRVSDIHIRHAAAHHLPADHDNTRRQTEHPDRHSGCIPHCGDAHRQQHDESRWRDATHSAPTSILYHFDQGKVSESVLGDLHADGSSSFPGSFLSQGADLQLPVLDRTVTPPALLYRLPAFERVDGQLSVNEKIMDELVSQDSRENITWAGSYESTAVDTSPGSPRLEYTIQYDNQSSTNICRMVSSRSKGSCAEVVPSVRMHFYFFGTKHNGTMDSIRC